MNSLQEAALATYYYGTWPIRVVANHVLSRRGAAPMCVLFYHRVADEPRNQWTISCKGFAAHMKWLQERFEFISLDEVQNRMRSGVNENLTVSITFDDGYADNCDFAIPYLLERKLPVTYFVALRGVRKQVAFPHDIEEGVPLKPNSVAELRRMADAGIEIGAHTRTHRDLGGLTDRRVLFDEVVTARDELQDLIGHPVRYFAFPFGLHDNLNSEAIELARQSGFAGVCSAFGDYNRPGGDPFHIKRIHGDREFVRLKNWMTLDPRKLTR